MLINGVLDSKGSNNIGFYHSIMYGGGFVAALFKKRIKGEKI
jgi:hypothetical protein